MRGIPRWLVDSPHKGQWRGALVFSLIRAWTNGWANNRDAGDLRRHRARYDVTLMPMEDFFVCSAGWLGRDPCITPETQWPLCLGRREAIMPEGNTRHWISHAWNSTSSQSPAINQHDWSQFERVPLEEFVNYCAIFFHIHDFSKLISENCKLYENGSTHSHQTIHSGKLWE